MPVEYTTTVWECEHCFREFDDEDECIAHENKCENNPNYNEATGDAVTPLCRICENCTAEGYRPNECKMEHPDSREVFHCDSFTPARDLSQAA